MGKGEHHTAAALTITLSALNLLGVSAVLISKAVASRREQVQEGGDDGGARRLRRMLIVSLLFSDGFIA